MDFLCNEHTTCKKAWRFQCTVDQVKNQSMLAVRSPTIEAVSWDMEHHFFDEEGAGACGGSWMIPTRYVVFWHFDMKHWLWNQCPERVWIFFFTGDATDEREKVRVGFLLDHRLPACILSFVLLDLRATSLCLLGSETWELRVQSPFGGQEIGVKKWPN